MHPTTQGSVTWTAAINLNPSKYSTRLFWTHSKQVFPLCHKWFKLEPRLCPVCSAEITGPADALWACVLICADADSQYLLIPTLVSAGHRTDVGDYKGGFREAVGPSVCGSNLLWRRRKASLNLQWEVRWNKPQWACESGLKTNVFLLSFNWKENSKSSFLSPAEWRREEILIPQIFIKILICELISGIMTLKCQHRRSNWVQGESLEESLQMSERLAVLPPSLGKLLEDQAQFTGI